MAVKRKCVYICVLVFVMLVTVEVLTGSIELH